MKIRQRKQVSENSRNVQSPVQQAQQIDFKDNRYAAHRVSQLQQVAEAAQRMPEEDELMKGRFESDRNLMATEAIQCAGLEDEDLLQGKFNQTSHGKSANVSQRKPNATGLPDHLKTGMETLSGSSLDHVKVHYNSAKPAAVNAHAYAQGSDIHLASGQEQHLPHELGHIVQQMQGRVKPTVSVNGVQVNDDAALESEATQMGEAALQRSVSKAELGE